MIEIIDGQSQPVESFVLEIFALQGFYESRHDIDFRGALTRISTLEPGPKLSEDSSFQVCFRRRSGDAPTLEKNLWIPRLAQAPFDSKTKQDDFCAERLPAAETRRLVPLGAVDDQELKVQVMALLQRY
ncbi:hypothetical protein FB639_000620 [Coemansia asiatica]|nr:hypothetical protein FB639_000620 [Coemansia asiatica]